MPELTAKSLLTTLRETEILSEQRLAELEQEFDPKGLPKALVIQLVRSGELTSWQAKFLLSGREGLRVGKYILRERLCQDELGDRILAIHQRLDRLVDLQILPPQVNEQSPAFQAFFRHVSSVAHLDHPNLIHVYDIDREGGRHYLVSEHFDAPRLRQITGKGCHWSIAQIASMARQLLGGVFYAHSKGVNHTEIGPETIWISDEGIAKIGDLAVAELRHAVNSQGVAERSELNAIPENDYRSCVAAVLQLLNHHCKPASAEELRQLKDILEPLHQMAGEKDVESTIFKLDQWLEHHQTTQEVPKASPQRSATSAAAGRKALNSSRPKNDLPLHDGKFQNKIPVGRLASVVSLVLLLSFLSWTWYRINTGQQPPSARQAVASSDQTLPKKSPKSHSDSKSGSSKSKSRTSASAPVLKESSDNRVAAETGEMPIESIASDDQIEEADSSEVVDIAPDLGGVASAIAPTLKAPEILAPALESGTSVRVVLDRQPVPQTENTAVAKASPSPPTAAENQSPQKEDGPFAKTPRAVDLPEITNTAEVTLGEVNPGDQYLLACEILTSDVVTRRTKFSLERMPGEQSQAWTIVGDTSSGEPTPIAKVSLTGTDLKFQWQAEISPDLNYSFLRNCLLVLKLGDETLHLCLRKPIAIGTAKVTADESQAKLSFDLDYFPFESEMAITEFLEIADVKFSSEDDITLLVEPPDQLVSKREPLRIFLTAKTERFLFLEVETKISKKSEITAALRIEQNPKSKLYSEKLADEAEAYLKRVAGARSQEYELNKAYEAPYGQITKHKDKVKKLAQLLESENGYVLDFAVQRRRANALFSKPIRFRVFFKLDDIEIDLATWDGNPHVPK